MNFKPFFFTVLLTFASSAFAQWLPLNAAANINQNQVSVNVTNGLYPLIECQGRVFGRTQYNAIRTAWFHDLVPYGQYRFAYVNTFPGEFFVEGWNDIRCIVR
jgi:hypothetical protein